MTVHSEQEAMEMTGDDLLYMLNWGSYEERQLVDAELRRRLEEWERRFHTVIEAEK